MVPRSIAYGLLFVAPFWAACLSLLVALRII
jgi:hypothetical protein